MSMPASRYLYNDTACYGRGPLRVRKETLAGSVESRFMTNLSWIERCENACAVADVGDCQWHEYEYEYGGGDE